MMVRVVLPLVWDQGSKPKVRKLAIRVNVDQILLIGPPRRLLVLFRMSGMFTGMSLGWSLRRLCSLLGMLSLGLL